MTTLHVTSSQSMAVVAVVEVSAVVVGVVIVVANAVVVTFQSFVNNTIV